MPKYFTSNIPDPVWGAYVDILSESDTEPEDRSECIGIPLDAIYSSVAPNAKLGLTYHHEGDSLLVVSKRFFPNSKPTDKLVLDHIIVPLQEQVRQLECHKYGFVITNISMAARGFEEGRTENQVGVDIYTSLEIPNLPLVNLSVNDYTNVTVSGTNSYDGYFSQIFGYDLRAYVNETSSLTDISDAKAVKLAARIGDGLRKLARFNTHLIDIGLYLS